MDRWAQLTNPGVIPEPATLYLGGDGQKHCLLGGDMRRKVSPCG